jgi:hypothetical protein
MGGRKLEDIVMLELFLYIITGWIIIGLWQRFIENFFYNGLGLDKDLPYHNFIVMFVITSTFLFVVSFISEILSKNPAGVENDQLNSGIFENNNQSLNKNGRESSGTINKRDFDFDQKRGLRQLSATVTSVESETVGRRSIPSVTKSSYDSHHRIKNRTKKMAKNRLHRVGQILHGWDTRDRGDAPFNYHRGSDDFECR